MTDQQEQPSANNEALFGEMLDELRRAFLHLVDVIERGREVSPRTSEIRKWWYREQKTDDS